MLYLRYSSEKETSKLFSHVGDGGGLCVFVPFSHQPGTFGLPVLR